MYFFHIKLEQTRNINYRQDEMFFVQLFLKQSENKLVSTLFKSYFKKLNLCFVLTVFFRCCKKCTIYWCNIVFLFLGKVIFSEFFVNINWHQSNISWRQNVTVFYLSLSKSKFEKMSKKISFLSFDKIWKVAWMKIAFKSNGQLVVLTVWNSSDHQKWLDN